MAAKELPAWAVPGHRVIIGNAGNYRIATITRVTKTSAWTIPLYEGASERRWIATGWRDMDYMLEEYGSKGDAWRSSFAYDVESDQGKAVVNKAAAEQALRGLSAVVSAFTVNKTAENARAVATAYARWADRQDEGNAR